MRKNKLIHERIKKLLAILLVAVFSFVLFSPSLYATQYAPNSIWYWNHHHSYSPTGDEGGWGEIDAIFVPNNIGYLYFVDYVNVFLYNKYLRKSVKSRNIFNVTPAEAGVGACTARASCPGITDVAGALDELLLESLPKINKATIAITDTPRTDNKSRFRFRFLDLANTRVSLCRASLVFLLCFLLATSVDPPGQPMTPASRLAASELALP